MGITQRVISAIALLAISSIGYAQLDDGPFIMTINSISAGNTSPINLRRAAPIGRSLPQANQSHSNRDQLWRLHPNLPLAYPVTGATTSWLPATIQLGLTNRMSTANTNAISSHQTTPRQGQGNRYDKPDVTLAITYWGDGNSLFDDADLDRRDTVTPLVRTQYLSVDAAVDVIEWIQLRAGYRVDMEQLQADTVTLGIGLSPSDELQLDLAATTDANQTAGGQVALRFSF